jgi:large subunit ribosomal protein L4
MASSPIWRGGGKIFPNSPEENFGQKVNRKMFRAGVSAILSQLVRDERLVVVDSLTVDSPKTKEFAAKVKSLGLEQALVITKELDENLYLSSRNLTNVLVIEAAQADPYSLVRFKKIVITRDAVKQLEEQWA